jgi:membrane protein
VSVDHHEQAHPGAHADSPTDIPARGWRQIVLRALHRAFLDRVTLIAAGVAFFGFLALFPSLIAAVLLYGLVSTPADLAEHVDALARTIPAAAADVLAEQMQDLVDADQGRLGFAAVVSVLVALWSAFVGMDHLLISVNVVYEETERSGFLRRRGLALLFTLGAAVVFAVLLTLIAVFPVVVDGGVLLGLGRWVLVVGVFALSLAAIYRFGPDRRQARFPWVSVGAIVATAFWLVASAIFSLYVSEFDRYSRSYGALAGVVVLLVWMWLSVVAILLGAEINAEAEHQTDADSTVGPDRPRGARDAVKADEAVGRPLHVPRHADGPPPEGADEPDSLDRAEEALTHPADRARPHRPGHHPEHDPEH